MSLFYSKEFPSREMHKCAGEHSYLVLTKLACLRAAPATKLVLLNYPSGEVKFLGSPLVGTRWGAVSCLICRTGVN